MTDHPDAPVRDVLNALSASIETEAAVSNGTADVSAIISNMNTVIHSSRMVENTLWLHYYSTAPRSSFGFMMEGLSGIEGEYTFYHALDEVTCAQYNYSGCDVEVYADQITGDIVHREMFSGHAFVYGANRRPPPRRRRFGGRRLTARARGGRAPCVQQRARTRAHGAPAVTPVALFFVARARQAATMDTETKPATTRARRRPTRPRPSRRGSTRRSRSPPTSGPST